MFIRFRLALLLLFAFAPLLAQAQQPELVVQAGHTSPVNAVSFSPDGQLLASGSGAVFSAVEVNVVKLWDVRTGIELRTFVHDTPISWVGFSKDGRRLAAKGESVTEQVRVWDVASGAVLPGVGVDDGYESRAQTRDGKLSAEIDGKNIKLRDALTGRVLRTLATRTSDFQKVRFSPDSSVLATGGDRRSIRLWDLRAGVLRTLVGHTDYPVAADFSPDSRLFASGGRDLTVRIWDVASGRELQRLLGHTGGFVRGIKFSPDGRTLYCYDKAGFKLWDVATGRALVSVAGAEVYYEAAQNIAFNPQGNILAAEADGGIKLWATETGKELALLSTGGEMHFSPDGKLLAVLGDKQLGIWDVAGAKRLAVLPTADGGKDPDKHDYTYEVRFRRLALSPDARLLAALETDSRKITTGRIYLLEAATGKPLHIIEDPKIADAEMTFSADGKLLLIFQSELDRSAEEVVLVDVATGQRVRSFKNTNDAATFRELWTLAPHYFGGDYSGYSPNGHYVASFGKNGELQLLEPQTGRELITLIGIDENDWLVATPAGFFDGSPVAWKLITWRFDNNSFQYAPVEAFFNQFYYPGLLADVLAGKSPTPPAGKDLARIDRRQPQLTLTASDPARAAVVGGAAGNAAYDKRMVRLTVEVTADASAPAQAEHPRTGGARDLRLFRNGSLVRAWHGDLFTTHSGCQQLRARGAAAPQRARCETSVPVVAGANEFTAYAFNHASVKSVDATLSITGADSLKRRGTTYILAVGVNRYANAQYNLKYAVADAAAFSAEVKRQQEGLGRTGHVQVITLFDEQATKQNLLTRLAALTAQVQPEDTLFVYFAGHGTAHENRFYLLPHDLGYMGARTAVDQAALAAILAHGISDRELETAFEKIDATQLVFVLDACNSGQALEAEEKRRGPMNSQGLAQLAYEKGMYILTAAQSFQAAQEAAQVGHGLLTYALVEEGLRQAMSDGEPRDGQIVIREWLDYATARVPRMQLDKMKAARGLGLDLAFTEAERGLDADRRSAQRPRVFYRREPEVQPPVIARPAAHP